LLHFCAISIEKNKTKNILSYIVVVMEAYILINSEPRMVWNIAKAALDIEGVKMAHAVTGQFDVVAYVEFSHMNILEGIISELQLLKGVKKTQTAIAIPTRLK
jgi:hypothetical protein